MELSRKHARECGLAAIFIKRDFPRPVTNFNSGVTDNVSTVDTNRLYGGVAIAESAPVHSRSGQAMRVACLHKPDDSRLILLNAASKIPCQ